MTLNGASNATVTVGGVNEDTIKNIEKVLGGTAADTLTGDTLSNTFRGGGGADILNGQGGVDTADYSDKTAAVSVTLNGSTNATVTVGGVNEDTIKNFEKLIGGTAGDTLVGDSLANSFTGGAGNDTLTGGGAGDFFLLNAALNAATNVDHMTDFASEDTIQLENAVFTALTTTGALVAGAFRAAAGATSAADTDDRIVYNTTTGALYYDADGVGGVASVQFAVLDNHAAVTNADFFVV